MDEILSTLTQKKTLNIHGFRGSSDVLLAARSAEKTNRPLLCVVPSERSAELLQQDFKLFTELPAIHYPGYDIPPYIPLSPDPITVAARLAALYQSLTEDNPPIIIASAEALLRRTIPKKILAGQAELVISNEETDQQELGRQLIKSGYEHVPLVKAMGDFSIRGGIIDVFPPGFANPVRLDFFGDTVESIRSFDPITQRSIGELPEVIFLPVSNILLTGSTDKVGRQKVCLHNQDLAVNWQGREKEALVEQIDSGRRFPGIEFFLPLFYETLSTPFDYLSEKTMVFLFDPPEIDRTIQLTWERIEANFQEAESGGTPALKPEAIFLPARELAGELEKFTLTRLRDLAETKGSKQANCLELPAGDHKLLKQEIDLRKRKHGLLSPLLNAITSWLGRGDQVIMACRSRRHLRNLAELLERHGQEVTTMSSPVSQRDLTRARGNNSVLLYDQPLTRGFSLPDEKVHFLSESELFGEQRLAAQKTGRSRKPDDQERIFAHEELKENDIVVHRDHGLGIYNGLITLELGGQINDFLLIHYKGDDKLYIPVDRLNTISKYKGISDKQPKLDKLGGKSWLTTRKKVKDAVRQVALDLLDLYAKREMKKGRAFSPPDELFYEMEEAFPFEETPGQAKAISEVLNDLSSDKPMDRLICGDVGYGKTEVAVRGSFKVVEDGFQVAMLVPTTVLAEQHAQTFRDRLAGLPVRVESLNRFRPRGEQKKILADLKNGKVDIIISTHRLLSRDVTFKNLGLLIVDEEHRFGVKHKEKIKRLRAEVDILTLTATPIPRTLQMSLLGIRDLSVINTPPEHRRKVLTFVARHDDLVIKEAVSRELQRQGQVFLVHNRVRSINEMARQVQNLVPRARVAVAHGQMAGSQLEETMVRFINHEVDVLICTTIIESGLDISNANTIIINRADRLGLAEIYQLRGRVGRSSEQSYAYLLVPSMEVLSKDARDRLRALMDCSELGGGFKLAMSDLQIRGGGNILGISQSGHIAAVGYDLYLDLLQKTVSELKNKEDREEELTPEIEPEINLKLSAYLPSTYIKDTDQRYLAYRRMAGLNSPEELIELKEEMRDRYGRLPEEAENIFEIMGLKVELKKLAITKLEQGKEYLVFTFHVQTPVNPQNILKLMEKSKDRIRFTPDSRLLVRLEPGPSPSAQMIFNTARDVLAGLGDEPEQ